MTAHRTLSLVTTSLALTAAAASLSFASWTQVVHTDIPPCDPLSIPFDVDELGSPMTPFPADELIDHTTSGTWNPVCLMTDDPTVVDPVVAITNLTGRTFAEVWYVADVETRISNVDGLVEDAALAAAGFPPQREAFRIDNDISDPGGMHHPLISESIPNGLFDPGETWRFVLQDYGNLLGIAPDMFTSIGVGTASLDVAGVVPSSGSIIAIPVPEPSPMWLLPASLFGLCGWRSLRLATSLKRGATRATLVWGARSPPSPTASVGMFVVPSLCDQWRGKAPGVCLAQPIGLGWPSNRKVRANGPAICVGSASCRHHMGLMQGGRSARWQMVGPASEDNVSQIDLSSPSRPIRRTAHRPLRKIRPPPDRRHGAWSARSPLSAPGGERESERHHRRPAFPPGPPPRC